jgi:hypothetical protein
MYIYTISLTLALDKEGWGTPRLGRFTPTNDTALIVLVGGWVQGRSRWVQKNLAPHRNSIPRPPNP